MRPRDTLEPTLAAAKTAKMRLPRPHFGCCFPPT